ncbi:unnamed protein product [Closterium sp. Naga37s-1]|nr:unnamed protein product [Closterium sp. Naga37s-1]
MQFPCKEVGKPRQAWPTFVSYAEAAAFKMQGDMPGLGMVYDCIVGEWQEPMALERELAMGFMEDATAHPEVTERSAVKEALARAMLGEIQENDEVQHEWGHLLERRWVYPWEEEDEVADLYAEQTHIWLPCDREEAGVDKKREEFSWLEEAIERQRSRESYEREFGSREFDLMAATKEEERAATEGRDAKVA